MARLVPYRRRPRSLFGMDRGRTEILGESSEPINVEREVKAESNRMLNPWLF